MAAGRLAVTAVLAASGALGGALKAQPVARAPQSPFGGSVPVHIAHVGHIDVDLGPAGGRLARVACAGAGADTACFVGAPTP